MLYRNSNIDFVHLINRVYICIFRIQILHNLIPPVPFYLFKHFPFHQETKINFQSQMKKINVYLPLLKQYHCLLPHFQFTSPLSPSVLPLRAHRCWTKVFARWQKPIAKRWRHPVATRVTRIGHYRPLSRHSL